MMHLWKINPILQASDFILTIWPLQSMASSPFIN